MSDELGVDAGDGSAPFVITEPLGQSVIDSAETARRLAEREEWRERRREGKVADGESPPGTSFWAANGWIPVVALVPALALTLVVQVAAKVLGWLFGFGPGLAWLWALLIGFAVSSFVGLLMVEDHRDRAAAALADARREFTDPHDKALIAAGHRSALAVTGLWPRLPLGEELDVSRLRRKLCTLAGVLARRRELEDAAAGLRAATAGLPAGSDAARALAAQITQADTLYQAADAQAQQHAGDLADLARRCRALHDERQAVARARQASLKAEPILGALATAVRPPAEDTASTARQVAEILRAYRELDPGEGSSPAA